MFRLPKEIKDSIELYKKAVDELKTGGISSSRFKGIRVP